ncbi:hypothetical protein [Parasaccharibacter apium]|uniref:Uncharacterized protein n=1 Tax=Parasaccharibacter apium TaxID=1510841 RepID=A0ABX4ZPS9_9PROT|nr:hypothetical protein [Parasaccharibacter apium]POS61978.1 hypothetical protein ASO19_07275 [Parasaccharibacter apium]POS64273.1 hypothetical protein ASQ43_05305 [Parasaccharibacter apium]POS65179.1 hypothetical protein ASQ42_00850 [Parasaccharibacter apium]
MAIVTVPGGQQHQYPVSIPTQGAEDLNRLFSTSFASLVSSSGSGDGTPLAPSDVVGNGSIDFRMGNDATSLPQATVLGGQDTISAAGDGTRLSLGGTLSFLGGVGAGTHSVGNNATIFGTANSVYHYARQGSAGQSVFKTDHQSDALHPDNILFDASKSHQSLQAFAGIGDTIKGGTASDTITVHNTVSGGTDAGATLSGGSGSANLFQFLNNKGGHYTITDFGKAAGNKVGLKATDEQIGQMLEHQTVKGGNTTIELPNDQGQITFLDQNQLHPKDFQKF